MTGAVDLTDPRQNGACLVDGDSLDALGDDARAKGHLVRRIDLAGCRDKPDLLRRIASALAFPDGFGMNWDALADCLGDLAWLPPASGHAWLFDHAGDLRSASVRDFDTLCDVLDDACARWKRRGTPCFAFLGRERTGWPGPPRRPRAIESSSPPDTGALPRRRAPDRS